VSSPLAATARASAAGQRFGSGPQARADHDAVGAEHQRRGKAAPVGDAARGEQQRVGTASRKMICGFAYERQRRPRAAASPRLGALGDDSRGTGVERGIDIRHALDLADERHPRRVDPRRPGSRVAEGQEHAGRGGSARALSSAAGLRSSAQVMKPTPTRAPAQPSNSVASSGSLPSVPAYPPPISPSPPARLTPAARAPPATSAIGALRMGVRNA
jgi:hypothetical protein